MSGTPRRNEQQILDDSDRIVPDDSLEEFISKTVRATNERIRREADRHTIERDVSSLLESDPDFRQETVKSLPKGIHPEYAEEDAELWQKPASKAEFLDGAQGFVQIWIPAEAEGVSLVNATAGEYDRKEVVDAICEELEAAAA